MSAGAAYVAIAAAQAEQARCRAFMANFDPRFASIHDRREYARCVLLIDGDGGPASWRSRIAIAALLLASVVGAVLGALLPRADDPAIRVVLCLNGGLSGILAVAALYLGFACVHFVVRGRWL